MAQSTRQAIQLNNTGAERLTAGDIQGALEAFRGALSLVPARRPAGQGNSEGRPFTGAASLGIIFLESSQLPVHNDEEKPFVYEKPLVFSRVLPESQDGAAAFCGVVVFNMALLFDFRSTSNGFCSSSTYKTKALQLYEACIGLFSKTTPEVQNGLTSVMAAACNNKARICFEHSAFKECYGELHRLQMLLSMADHSLNKSDFLVERDIQGMLLNLLLLAPPSVAQAA